MTTWFTSDQHYGHRNIITYCGRPFVLPGREPSLAMMHDTLDQRWNLRVKDEDEVYVVGDFSFGPLAVVASRLKRLNGRKHLVRGNHDRHSNAAFRRAGFETVQKALWLDEWTLVIHRPQDWVNHALLEQGPRLRVISGHHHGLYKVKVDALGATWYNVGVDVRGFAPVTLQELLVG
jgi:calcineurin-like phosphoesterase family protein